tara:strand:+ start:1711 stop:1890 length:180 start_codon:yes stop_codon:yes gene_type:complete
MNLLAINSEMIELEERMNLELHRADIAESRGMNLLAADLRAQADALNVQWGELIKNFSN